MRPQIYIYIYIYLIYIHGIIFLTYTCVTYTC